MAENGDDQAFPREERRPNVCIEFEAVAQLLYVLLLLYFERPNIVLTSREMRYPYLRLLSFLGFPRDNVPDIRDFVDAGLYYTGNGDHVYCHCCDFGRSHWVSTDNPLDIHRRYAPNCPFFQSSNNVNLNSICNIRRQRGTVPIRFEELPGPTLDTNDQGIHLRIRSSIFQTEEVFEPNVLPSANLPFESTDYTSHSRETAFSESNAAATANMNTHYHGMLRRRQIGYEQGNGSETTSRNIDVDDSSNNSDSLSRNFSVSVRNDPDENETARKAIIGCTNEQNATNFMITYPSPECSRVLIQPSSNGYSVSLQESNENSITTTQQTLLENNSSSRNRNPHNDNTNNSDTRCQSVWENNECGAVATTNVSDGLLFNNNDVCVQNLNDVNILNSELRCQTNESCAAAATNESDVIESNNNDVHVENIDDDDDDDYDDDDADTLNLEAICHSVEEKNVSGAAATIKESSAEKCYVPFNRPNETNCLQVEKVTQTENSVNREGEESVYGPPPGNQEVTENPETISIAGNNHKENNSLHHSIQNDEAIHGLLHDGIERVEERHRQVDKGNPVVRNGRDIQKFCKKLTPKKRPKQRYKQNGNSNRASSHPCSKVPGRPYTLDAGNHVERNGKDIKKPSTKRKPANRHKQRSEKDENSSRASSQLCTKVSAERVPGISFLLDKAGHENAITWNTRTDNKVGVRTGQNDPKRNKVCTPSPKAVLPEDGSLSKGKDKTTAEIGKKMKCLPSKEVSPLEDNSNKKTVDLKEERTCHHPTETPTANNEDDSVFGKRVENELKKIKDPVEKLQKQQAIMKIFGNG